MLLLVLAISCNKGIPDAAPADENLIVEKPKTCVPVSLKWRDSVIYTFKTNEVNQITDITGHSLAAGRGNIKLKYDEKGRIEEVEYRIKPGQFSNVHKYFYGAFGEPLYRELFYRNVQFEIDSFYYDSTKSLIKIHHYVIKNREENTYELRSQTEYKWLHDIRELHIYSPGGFMRSYWKLGHIKNPFSSFSLYYDYLFLYPIENLKFLPTYLFESGPNATDQQETNFSYEYNDLGYPITMKGQLLQPDSASTIFHIDYICK